MPYTAETKRLRISPLTTDDFGFIFELLNSKGWLDFIGNRNIHSKEDAVSFIEKINTMPNYSYLVVRVKVNGVPIGIVSLIKRDYLQHHDIGFAFLPKFTGYGYAYEATKQVLTLVTREAHCNTVLATTLPQNMPSIKLLKRLGFHFEKDLEISGNKLHLYSNAGLND